MGIVTNEHLERAAAIIADVGTDERIARAAESLRAWAVTESAGYFELMARAMVAQLEHDCGDNRLSPVKYFKKMTSAE